MFMIQCALSLFLVGPLLVSARQPLKAVIITADSNRASPLGGSSKTTPVVFGPVAAADLAFPGDMECVPQPVYRLRPDGKPGREITVNVKGGKLLGNAQLEVTADGKTESVEVLPLLGGHSLCRVLLPSDVAIKRESQVTVTLRQGAKSLKKTFTVPAMRHWTVYLYPHSHVDIGYTAPQDIAEFIHKRNIEEGVKLAEATKDYPVGARYRWNPEVTWPLERLWQTATPEQKERVLRAIRDGQLCVDASYVNLNTSACCDEELFQVFRFSREMQKRTGVPMDTFQQMDVPGMSWGLVPVMARRACVTSWPGQTVAVPAMPMTALMAGLSGGLGRTANPKFCFFSLAAMATAAAWARAEQLVARGSASATATRSLRSSGPGARTSISRIVWPIWKRRITHTTFRFSPGACGTTARWTPISRTR